MTHHNDVPLIDEGKTAQVQDAPSDEYVGWYCAHCERGVDSSEVTYYEQHEVCGRVITNDRPPKPAPSVPTGWPTEEMTSAFAEVFNVRDQKNTFGPAFRAALKAAPEAKP